MKLVTMIVLLLVSIAAFGQIDQRSSSNEWTYWGPGFYSSMKQKTFTKDEIRKIQSVAQVSVGYDNARRFLFGEIYILNIKGENAVRDVYCDKVFTFKSPETTSGMHQKINIEHTWPQSKFNPRFEKGMQKSDMHHLFLTDSVANSNRGNLDFADLTGVANEITAQNCDISTFGRAGGRMAFMPPTPHLGNLARALFYFSVRYDLDIKSDYEKLLRQWHRNDPVDAEEIRRHTIIAKKQNVRNPFVDHPEIVDMISDF
jgi:deoxyribonuclease-1